MPSGTTAYLSKLCDWTRWQEALVGPLERLLDFPGGGAVSYERLCPAHAPLALFDSLFEIISGCSESVQEWLQCLRVVWDAAERSEEHTSELQSR